MIKEGLQFIKRTLTRPEGLLLSDTGPVSAFFGMDRGTPIDRYYIEKFLMQNQQYIQGKVLEIAESTYSKKFGQNVKTYEVLHVDETNPKATLIGDLTNWNKLPKELVDCFICTQTFNFIYNFQEAIKGAYHLLKREGVLLATVSGISQISRYDMDRWGDYWRFTTLSAAKAFSQVFGEDKVSVDHYGNCLSASSFLRGIAAEELSEEKLKEKHPDYQLVITIKAVK
ncbi:MAG TPA: hypothetical protein VL095_11995 [Flavisolibacter sp.]|nr:hypothetical protein [Flavisolibacter sp.]